MKMKTILALALMTSFQAVAVTKTFKLYTQANINPNPGCDVHVQLELKTRVQGVTAHLVNRVSGFCELYVEPNPRTYKLPFVKKSCGSNVYASEDLNVALIDHRGRICDDLIPALIMVQEGDVTYYGHDQR